MTLASEVSVLIVDDSAIVRRVIRAALAALPGVRVVGEAPDGRAGLRAISALQPDLVTLDVEMPGLDGLGVLRELASVSSPPRVLMISSLTRAASHVTVEALCLGAWDFLPKPALNQPGARAFFLRELRKRIEVLSASAPERATRPEPPVGSKGSPQVVGIGVSTGGPRALLEVLARVPADFPLPLLVVQHMPPGLTEPLAESLDAVCALEVCEARPCMEVTPGRVLLAPGGRHLEVVHGSGGVCTHLTDAPPERSCRPSASVLLSSLARVYAKGAVGLIMTGIGDDGLAGCREVARVGGTVLTQDEASCAVYGMPRSVVEEGLADRVLALEEIPAALAELGARSHEAA